MTNNSCDLIVETEFKGIHWRRSQRVFFFSRMFVDFVLNLSRRELGSVAVYCGAYLISECLHVHIFIGKPSQDFVGQQMFIDQTSSENWRTLHGLLG